MKVEFANVKAHDPVEEHDVCGSAAQAVDPHCTTRSDEEREGSKAQSHGAEAPGPVPEPETHGLQRRLDMPLVSKYTGNCCAGVPYPARTV
jgi:hypothetical protein